MQIRQLSRRLVAVTVFLLVSIIVLSGIFLLPDRLAQHLLGRLSLETEIQISPVRVEYSLFSGELIVKDTDLYFDNGIQASADELRLRISPSQLWDERLAIDTLYLQNPYLNVDLDQIADVSTDIPPLQQPLMNFLRHLEFSKGGVYFHSDANSELQIAVELAFSEMLISRDSQSVLTISITGMPVQGEWQLLGEIAPGRNTLAGELDLKELPVKNLLDSLNIQSEEHWEQGLVSADQDITWSPQKGIELEGSVSIRNGLLGLSDHSRLRWENLDLTGVVFNQTGYSVARAEFTKADLLLDEQTFLTTPQQYPTVSSAEFSQSRLFRDFEHWSAKSPDATLTDLNGQFSWIEQALSLQATANRSGIPLSLESNINDDGAHLRMNVRGLDMAILPEAERLIAGYDLAGTRLYAAMQLSWQKGQVKSTGQLTLAEVKARQHGTPEIDLALIKSVMTDNKGSMSFVIPEQVLDNSTTINDAIVTQLRNAILETWTQVSQKPYEYLARLSGKEGTLEQPIEFATGRSELCPESMHTINHWINILNRRPGLALAFQGQASRAVDQAGLARHELEQDLMELYAAIHRKKPDKVTDIPVEIRLQLVEQMYLRINNRKLPDISEQDQQRRVRKAEQWLLSHWPVKQEVLLELARARAESLRESLEEGGLAAQRLQLEPVRIVNEPAKMQLELVY